jgi:hypothetical protein
MSWLRKRRRRKDAVFSYQRVRFQLSKIGAVLPFDCFDCATKWGNNLQGTCDGAKRSLFARMGFVITQVHKCEEPGAPALP